MNDASFSTGPSWLHAVDPLLRVVCAIFFAGIVAMTHAFSALATGFVLSLIMVAAARLPFAEVIRRLGVPLLFLVVIWAVLPWSYKGDPLFAIGPVTFSRPGVRLCLDISLKAVTLMLAFMALVATLTVDTLGHTLNRMHLPDKLVHLILITYRYLSVLEQEYQRLVRAMKIRNFRPATSLHCYRTYAYLVGMLFVRASDRAQRVHGAMICRGFTGRFISLREFPPGPHNRIFVGITLISVLLLVALAWRG
ncbi:cobalt ECF transporter T component CbiQ [Desulfosarcina sp. OttesenSCG-928-G10]|nr:cobalt ECF transporter T component CbiQ [Desulfosarcina sp. OttesenSCG-928-G10]MDL2321949.1 cobalt ECF transporter T component CbiQ [Desulfosarcina sp. OttesenSCG-928-B08]